jgi:hypothetical protein
MKADFLLRTMIPHLPRGGLTIGRSPSTVDPPLSTSFDHQPDAIYHSVSSTLTTYNVLFESTAA